MSQMRNITIDFDIHKLIVNESRNFAETPNTVLRRLLGLSELKEQTNGHSKEEHSPIKGAWTGKGVTLPAATKLRLEYRGHQHFGVIKDASWFVDGEYYKSPSAAAGGCARTKKGTRPSLDGWNYWQVKRPGDERWLSLKALRNSA